MSNRRPAEVFSPGEFIREELHERGWTQTDLAKIMGRPVTALNLIISGKKSITPDTAMGFAAAFGTSAEFWLNLQNAYQLSKVDDGNHQDIKERAALFQSAPVKDMQKRGWIKPAESIIDLRQNLDSFFGVAEIENLRVAAKSSIQNAELTPEQIAWCVRCLRLAKSLPAQKFTTAAFESGITKLCRLTDFPENVKHVPKILAEMGIRFVVVEHLPKTKIDGAALWIGKDWEKPVIALSLRYDRIDSFWHTLMHECSHIRHRDHYILDVDLVGSDRCLSTEALSQIEQRANQEAAETLIPESRLRQFISITKPFYYREKIIQFANQIKIHPGIIAGQLQHRGEIQWNANRDMLVKIRSLLIATALTDGWGAAL
jgi:HTH-type transcriptional regulator / antitoxin HigA